MGLAKNMYLFYILFSYIIRIVKQIVNHLSIPNKAKQPLILINNLPIKYKKKQNQITAVTFTHDGNKLL